MNFDFWRLRFNEWKLMRRKKQHSDSAKKLKILTEKLFFTTDDESCSEEFQCTKTLKCFAFLTQLFKFESSIISSEKSFSFFFRVSFFSFKIGRFILRQRLRRPSCVHSAFRKWIQQVWQRNVIFVFINLFHTTHSKSEFRIKPANVKCKVFMKLFMQVFQKVEPIESCKRVT